MILKDKQFRNKFILQDDSTNADFKEILKTYNKVCCIICNRNTAKRFRVRSAIIFGPSNITINNKIPDQIFWINGIY